MKKIIAILSTLFFSANIFAEADNSVDWNEFSYETVTMRCGIVNHQVEDYSSSLDSLNLRGMSCAKAISRIKSIAAYPVEYVNISMLPGQYTYYLIEFLKEKTTSDS